MVSPTATWPAVSVNGSLASNSAARPPSTRGRGMAGRAAAAIRRWASAACSTKASSHFSRSRARSRSGQSSGRWMARMASACPYSPYRSRSGAGSGSSPASSVCRMIWIDLPMIHELTLARGRVDRDHLGGELRGQLGGEVRVGRRAGQQLVLRVDQLEPVAVAGDGAREHADHAGHEPLKPCSPRGDRKKNVSTSLARSSVTMTSPRLRNYGRAW